MAASSLCCAEPNRGNEHLPGVCLNCDEPGRHLDWKDLDQFPSGIEQPRHDSRDFHRYSRTQSDRWHFFTQFWLLQRRDIISENSKRQQFARDFGVYSDCIDDVGGQLAFGNAV
jgi:hypothetical protein